MQVVIDSFITEMPAIGKSIFSAYWHFCLCSKFSHVILHGKSRTSLIENGRMSSIAKSDIHDVVRNHGSLSIVDGIPLASSANCFTILVTSVRFIMYE